MKGTMQGIVGGESGFLLFDDLCCLDNWSANRAIYRHRKKDTYPVKNVFVWLLSHGWIEINGNEIIRKYRADANEVTLSDLLGEGTIYELTDIDTGDVVRVLRVHDWA